MDNEAPFKFGWKNEQLFADARRKGDYTRRDGGFEDARI